ncbi:hypothetical protein ACLKNH_000352 [Staphylococcus pseudintermedius]
MNMLTLRLVHKDSNSVTYDYSPENREKPGRITMDIKTQKVIYVKKSEYEEGNFDMYLGHAFHRVKDNVKQDTYPIEQLVGW